MGVNDVLNARFGMQCSQEGQWVCWNIVLSTMSDWAAAQPASLLCYRDGQSQSPHCSLAITLSFTYLHSVGVFSSAD